MSTESGFANIMVILGNQKKYTVHKYSYNLSIMKLYRES